MMIPVSDFRFIAVLIVVALAPAFRCCLADEAATGKTPGIVARRPSSGRFVEIPNGYMVPYPQKVPGAKHEIWMEPIPGAAAAKAGGKPIAPFWMARYETRHADYLPYMRLYRAFKEFESQRIRPVTEANRIDAVTAPTEIYDTRFAFEFGMEMENPVGTMTLLGARQYTKWLSRLTRMEFRLPTAAEWEHACRAGSTTKWHFGDDPEKLKEYACFGDNNASPGYQKVGLLKPNAWGLFDMHGNMAEWVLQPGITDPNQQILKGGCWEFPAERCRSESVLKYDDQKYRNYDPNLPQSPWWLASDESRWGGFRILRPLKPMTKAEQRFAWECHTPEEQHAVDDQLELGRGAIGLVDPKLPAAVQRLNEKERRR